MMNRSKIVFIFLIAISFLFSGNPHKKNPYPLCDINYFEINSLIGFPVNCDAFGFIGAAISPSYLLKENYNRQSRPLYILAGTAVGYSIYALSTPFHEFIANKVSSIFPEVQDEADAQTPVLYFCFYLGFVLINFIVALATLSIFLRTLHLIAGPWRHSAFLQYSIILLLFSNQITQLFTWTVHTQLFNLLTPLYCLYVGLLIAAGNISEYRVRWICFVSGLLLLFYGNFLLVLPMVFVADLMHKKEQPRAMGWAKSMVLRSLIFFTPLLAWHLILKFNGLTLYSDELHGYRQFVWVFDSAQIGFQVFWRNFLSNAFTFAKTTGGLVFSIALFALIKIRFRLSEGSQVFKLKNSKIYYRMATFYSLIAFFFLLFLGYYADRLTAIFLPILTLGIGVHLNQFYLSKKAQWVLSSIILLWHIYIIVFGVPYFYKTFYH